MIVPRRLRADWRQEWEAELHYRETQLTEWDHLTFKTKLNLLWHSMGALVDASSATEATLASVAFLHIYKRVKSVL